MGKLFGLLVTTGATVYRTVLMLRSPGSASGSGTLTGKLAEPSSPIVNVRALLFRLLSP